MFQVILFEGRNQVFSDEFEGTVVIGRAEEKEPLFKRLEGANETKIAFVPHRDGEWSRRQVVLEPADGEAKVKVKNDGSIRSIRIEKIRELSPKEECEAALPVVIDLGNAKVARVQAAGGQVRGLPTATIPPLARGPRTLAPTLASLSPGGDQKEIIAWLSAATDVLQSAVDNDDFFERATAAAVQMVDLDSAGLSLYRGGEWHPVASSQSPTSRDLEARRPSQGVLNQVLKQRRTLWEVPEGAQDRHTSLVGVKALVAAPVLDRQGQVIGVLYGERRRPTLVAKAITEAEAMLIEVLARGVAAGLARQQHERAAAALNSEIEIGRKLQSFFLPKTFPQFDNWEIGTKYLPARDLSGDFYDVFRISTCHVGLVIADVCNKGVGSALFMAVFRSLIQSYFQQGMARDLTGCSSAPQQPGLKGERDLMSLVIELNALTSIALTNNYVANVHCDANMFATVFLGVLNTTTGLVHFINAGHDFPIHMGPSGVKGRLKKTGSAVGMFPDQVYTIQTVVLEPGDLLLCYTDGVPDARSPKGESFTEKRLLELVSRQPATSAAEVLDLVESSVTTHTATNPLYDDVTMLAVYRRAPGDKAMQEPPLAK